MTDSRWRVALSSLAASALLLSSCTSGGSGASGTSPGNLTLTTAIGVNIASLDPVAAASADSATVVQMVNEPLAYFDAEQKLQPLLATSWKPSADGMSWTFTLRKGVTFSDGEPFDATAVKFTFDRLLDPKTTSAYVGSLAVIKEVKAVDAEHVEFVLRRVYPAFPSAVTPANASIVAPGAAKKAPNTPSKLVTPVGTGPYAYQRFLPNDRITVVRNDRYWGRRPSYRTQDVRMVPTAASREAMLLARQADVAVTPPAPDLPSLQRNRAVRLVKASSGYMIQVGFNTRSRRAPQLQNPAVRLALEYAIDRDSIVKNVLFGGGRIPSSPISPNVFGYCSVGSFPYDPNKAKQMLADAGATGMKLTMQSPQGRYTADYQVAQAVAGYLRDIGVDVTLLKPPDFATYISQLYVPPEKARADLSLIGWGTIFPDGSEAMGNMLTTSIPPEGVSNFYYYSNKSFEKAMRTGDSSLDDTTRKNAYCTAQREMWQNPPALFLYIQQTSAVTSTKVTGVYPNNLWFVTTWAKPA